MAHSFSIDAKRLVNDLGGASALFGKLKAKYPDMQLSSVKTIEKWIQRKSISVENFMRCKAVGADLGKKITLDDYVSTK